MIYDCNKVFLAKSKHRGTIIGFWDFAPDSRVVSVPSPKIFKFVAEEEGASSRL